MNDKKLAQQSDVALVELARHGSERAFAELWKRHEPAVIIATRSFTGFDPDDVAQETFLRILKQIQAGGGPETAFRAYAIMTARNVATNMARTRSSSEVTGVDDEIFEQATEPVENTESRLIDDIFTRQVFLSLPIRWQEVLWYREVEDLPVQQFSTYLGMSPNATSALLRRAKEGFKQAWIAASLEPVEGLPGECEWVVGQLPQLLRGKTTPGTQRKMKRHFQACERCADLSHDSKKAHSQLATILLPGLLGVASAAKYLAGLHHVAEATYAAGITQSATPLPAHAPTDSLLQASGTLSRTANVVAVAAVGALGLSLFATAFVHPLRLEDPDQTPLEEMHQNARHHSESPDGDSADGEESEQTSGASETEESDQDELENQGAGDGDLGSQPPETTAVPPNGEADASGTNANTGGGPARIVPVPLSGSPLDGTETGIYPRLSGLATAGATVYLSMSNEAGQTSSATVYTDAQGRWAYTPTALMGQLTVRGHQEYVIDGKGVVDAEVTVGTYSVGRGLSIEVDAISAQQTTIRVTGLVGNTTNQAVNVTSTSIGTLAYQQRATAPGEVTITVPYARADLGDLYYWQGVSAEGPRRVWWRIL